MMDDDLNPLLDLHAAMRDIENQVWRSFALGFDPVYLSPIVSLTPHATNWIHPRFTTQISSAPSYAVLDDPDPRYSVYSVGVDPNWALTPMPAAFLGAIAPPVADPYPDLRPRAPVQYSQSTRARQRSAVFTGKAGGCLRCGRDLTGQPVVNVAPATLPPATVHVGCVEVDDQIGAKDE